MKKYVCQVLFVIALIIQCQISFSQADQQNKVESKIKRELTIIVDIIVNKYSNKNSENEIICLIKKEIGKLMIGLVEEGSFSSNVPSEAYYFQIGIGTSLINDKVQDVIVIEIGTALHFPSIFSTKRFVFPFLKREENKIFIDTSKPFYFCEGIKS